ncbi:MAG: PKD domain-containing protein [Bacteroidota bacterium]
MKKIAIVGALLSCFFADGQKWQQLLMEGERDFARIQEAFYEEWDGRIVKKGNGYKQFKRWEYKNRPRLLKDGTLANTAAAHFLREKQELLQSQARTTFSEDSWEPMGPYSWNNGTWGYNPGMGRVNSIDIHPNEPNTLFVGTPSGGLWKSENGGNDWETLSEVFPVLGVTDFYIDPKDPEKMYVLTGDAYGGDTYSIGVFKSTDGGADWANDSNFSPEPNDFNRMYRMLVYPENSDTLLIAGNRGIWKSTDGANTWQQVNTASVVDLAFKPDDPQVIYASTNGTRFLHRSTDGGDTWDRITTPLNGLGRTVLGVSSANPDYLYILASSSSGAYGGVYRSEDAGLTFTLQSDSPNVLGYSKTGDEDGGQGWYDLAIAVNPEDAEDIYISGIHVWNSKDGGQTWFDEEGESQILNYWIYDQNDVENYVHADNHTIDILNGELYAGCDGGIWKSEDFGQTWQDLSTGLNNTQLYRLGLDPNDASVLVAGAQDNGSNILTGDSWTHIFGADGMEAVVDPSQDGVIYATFQFGGIMRFDNQGAGNIDYISGNLEGTGYWVTPYMLHPKNSDILYAGYADVWEYSNTANSWNKLSNFSSTETLKSLQVSTINPEVMYTSTGFNTFRTTNGGDTWENISAGLPTEFLTYLFVSENDANKVWASFSGYTEGSKVFQSVDGGDTWENISDGLPNVPINCIVHQRFSDDQLYVGTDIGVFQKNNSSAGWEPWFEGLPSVMVTELEIQYRSQKIVAATYGRGLWSADLISPPDIAKIDSDLSTITEGDNVVFSADFPEGVSPSYSWEFEGGVPATSSDPEPQVNYASEGVYSVKLNGLELKNLVKVLDKVAIEGISADTQIIPEQGQIQYSVTYEGNPTSWDWTFPGGTPFKSSEESPVVSYQVSGVYDVSLVLEGDTQDELVLRDFVTVESTALGIVEEVLVYPTFSADNIFLKIERPNTKVELISASGTMVYSEVANKHFSLDISNYAKGVYVLKLTNEESIKKMRIVKQ